MASFKDESINFDHRLYLYLDVLFSIQSSLRFITIEYNDKLLLWISGSTIGVPSLATSSLLFWILDLLSPTMTALSIYVLLCYLFIYMQTISSIFKKFSDEQN